MARYSLCNVFEVFCTTWLFISKFNKIYCTMLAYMGLNLCSDVTEKQSSLTVTKSLTIIWMLNCTRFNFYYRDVTEKQTY
jgi:hypothetical protein